MSAVAAEPRLMIAILAAGGSRRLGRPKQLEPIDGLPMLRRVAQVALAADVGEVAVVLGCVADQCVATLNDVPLNLILNDRWSDGLSTSLHAAVEAATARDVDGLLLMLGDQHALEPSDLRHLTRAWRADPGGSVAARHGVDAPGPPAILPRGQFDALRAARGDIGARAVLAATQSLALLDLPNAQPDLDVDGNAKNH